jgi:hypothetical protein
MKVAKYREIYFNVQDHYESMIRTVYWWAGYVGGLVTKIDLRLQSASGHRLSC